MTNYHKTILENGLKIITVPNKENLAVTLLVLVEAGSKYETKEINGLSHFLEHMCFKGTKNRKTALNISGELDGIGAAYNAFTSQEYTGYYAKAEFHHLDKVIDIVSDLYLNPVFNADEIEKEKGVIIEELNMYEDLPPNKVAELFDELMYGDQPAGWPIGGKKEIIRELKRDDFLKYRGAHYVAQATTVVLSGNFEEKDAIKKLEKAFDGMPVSKKFGKVKTVEKQNKPAVLLQHKALDQTHIVVGCRAFDVFDKRRFALDVLADALGGGMSSRLFQRVREKLGAAYYVNASADYHTDCGQLTVRAGIDNTKVKIVLRAILDEINNFTNKKISKEELQRAKNHLSGNLILGLETSDAQAVFYGGQEVLTKSVISPQEALENINKVTAEDILSVAQYVFKNDRLNLAIVGPFKDAKEFEYDLRLI